MNLLAPETRSIGDAIRDWWNRRADPAALEDFVFIDSLGDGELRRRLLQRNINERIVETLVRNREDPDAKQRIAQVIA